MRLTEVEARARLAAHDHGILCTVHAERGVDAVPVAYVADDDGYVGIPVDLVKPKTSVRLQRERNLQADPRATLLLEHWDRATGHGCGGCGPSCAGRATTASVRQPWRSGWLSAIRSTGINHSSGYWCCVSEPSSAGPLAPTESRPSSGGRRHRCHDTVAHSRTAVGGSALDEVGVRAVARGPVFYRAATTASRWAMRHVMSSTTDVGRVTRRRRALISSSRATPTMVSIVQ